MVLCYKSLRKVIKSFEKIPVPLTLKSESLGLGPLYEDFNILLKDFQHVIRVEIHLAYLDTYRLLILNLAICQKHYTKLNIKISYLDKKYTVTIFLRVSLGKQNHLYTINQVCSGSYLKSND